MARRNIRELSENSRHRGGVRTKEDQLSPGTIVAATFVVVIPQRAVGYYLVPFARRDGADLASSVAMNFYSSLWTYSKKNLRAGAYIRPRLLIPDTKRPDASEMKLSCLGLGSMWHTLNIFFRLDRLPLSRARPLQFPTISHTSPRVPATNLNA